MRTFAAHSDMLDFPAETIGQVAAARHTPVFFENDHVKIILPLLQDGDLPAAGVVDGEGRLTGLLTERVILRHIFNCSCDKMIHPKNIKKYLDDLQVCDVMIRKPETLDADLSIEEAASTMLQRGFRFMPVVHRADPRRLLGIVSERELAAQLRRNLERAKASEKSYKQLLADMLREPYGAGNAPLHGI